MNAEEVYDAAKEFIDKNVGSHDQTVTLGTTYPRGKPVRKRGRLVDLITKAFHAGYELGAADDDDDEEDEIGGDDFDDEEDDWEETP